MWFDGFLNKYPYTDFHEMNLDWILNVVKGVATSVTDLIKRVTNIEETIESGYNLPIGVVSSENQNLFHLLDIVKSLDAPTGYEGWKFNGFCTDGTYAYMAGFPSGNTGTTHLIKRSLVSGAIASGWDVDTGFFMHANNITLYNNKLYVTVNSVGDTETQVRGNQILVYTTDLDYVGTIDVGGDDGYNMFVFGVVDNSSVYNRRFMVAGISGTNDYYIMPELATTGTFSISGKTQIPEYYNNTRQGAHFGSYIYQLRSGGGQRTGCVDVYNYDGRLVTKFYLQGIDETIYELEDLTKTDDNHFWIMCGDGSIWYSANFDGKLTQHDYNTPFLNRSSNLQTPILATRSQTYNFNFLNATYLEANGKKLLNTFEMPYAVSSNYSYMVNGTLRYGGSTNIPLAQQGSLDQIRGAGLLSTTMSGHAYFIDVSWRETNRVYSLYMVRLFDFDTTAGTMTKYEGWDEVSNIISFDISIGSLAYENMGSQRSGFISTLV